MGSDIYIYIYIKRRKEQKKEHVVTCDIGNACKRKEYTSNLSLSSKMGWVAEVSSLCLDCQKKKKKGNEISKHAYGISLRKAL